MAGVGCPMTRHSKRIFCPSVHSRSLRSWVNLGGTTSEVTLAVEMSLTSLRAVESNTHRRIKYKYQNKWLWHNSFLSVSYFVRNMPKQLPHKIFKSNTTQELSFTYLLCLCLYASSNNWTYVQPPSGICFQPGRGDCAQNICIRRSLPDKPLWWWESIYLLQIVVGSLWIPSLVYHCGTILPTNAKTGIISIHIL